MRCGSWRKASDGADTRRSPWSCAVLAGRSYAGRQCCSVFGRCDRSSLGHMPGSRPTVAGCHDRARTYLRGSRRWDSPIRVGASRPAADLKGLVDRPIVADNGSLVRGEEWHPAPAGRPWRGPRSLIDIGQRSPDMEVPRSGNGRMDGFHKILENPHVGTQFIIPGHATLSGSTARPARHRPVGLRHHAGQGPPAGTGASTSASRCPSAAPVWASGQRTRLEPCSRRPAPRSTDRTRSSRSGADGASSPVLDTEGASTKPPTICFHLSSLPCHRRPD